MISAYIAEAFLVWRSRPMRSMLSVAGVFFGLFTVLAVLAIHSGTSQEIDDFTRIQGLQVFFVTPNFDPTTARVGVLGMDDIRELQRDPQLVSIMPRLRTEKEVRSPMRSAKTLLLGIDDRFPLIYRIRLVEGRFFFASEIHRKSLVCLITPQGRAKLFPLGTVLGQKLSVSGEPYTIVGRVDWSPTLTSRAFLTESPDLLLPFSNLLAESRVGHFFPFLEVRAELTRKSESVREAILHRLTHRVRGRESLFTVQSYQSYIKGSQLSLSKTLVSLLVMAAVSLFVGGIGIANVMLISVSERIHEIGIRMALGARREDILIQFLVEGTVLTSVGGMLAVLIAKSIEATLPFVWRHPLALRLPVSAIVGCLLLSALVGLIASAYPASHAASLIPSAALRYD